jgi:hypothetical protein
MKMKLVAALIRSTVASEASAATPTAPMSYNVDSTLGYTLPGIRVQQMPGVRDSIFVKAVFHDDHFGDPEDLVVGTLTGTIGYSLLLSSIHESMGNADIHQEWSVFEQYDIGFSEPVLADLMATPVTFAELAGTDDAYERHPAVADPVAAWDSTDVFGTSTIFVMTDLSAPSPAKLVKVGPGTKPSTNGTHVVYENAKDLALYDIDTGVISPFGDPAATEWNPVIGGTGSGGMRIAYEKDDNGTRKIFYRSTTDLGTENEWDPGLCSEYFMPRLNAGGNIMIYTGDGCTDGPWPLYATHFPTAGAPKTYLVGFLDSFDTDPDAWAPYDIDDDGLAYMRSGTSTVWVARLTKADL